MSLRARGVALAALAVLLALPWLLDTLRLRMAIEVLYFGLFAVSFNLLFGYAGLLSFGHAATFGVGGYAVGLALKHVDGLPLPVALGLGALAGAVIGAVIGFFCVRLRGTYFALLTLAFSQLLYAVALKWRSVTRGDDGLTVAVPDITLPGLGVLRTGQPAHFYWLALAVVLISLWSAWRFTRTPLGNAVLLMRENDERAQFMGVAVNRLRLFAFVVSAAFSGVAGALFAQLNGSVFPTFAFWTKSGEVIMMAILGGTQAFLGPLVGSFIMLALDQFFSVYTEYWPLVLGTTLLVLVLFLPEGHVGIRSLWRRPAASRPT